VALSNSVVLARPVLVLSWT